MQQRKLVEPRRQLATRDAGQTFLSSGPQIKRDFPQPDTFAPDLEPSRGALPNNRQTRQPATKQNRVPLGPLRWCMLRENSQPFAFGPLPLLFEEHLRVPVRSSSRNRHAQRAIGTYTDDVALRPVHADEIDGELWQRRGWPKFMGRSDEGRREG